MRNNVFVSCLVQPFYGTPKTYVCSTCFGHQWRTFWKNAPVSVMCIVAFSVFVKNRERIFIRCSRAFPSVTFGKYADAWLPNREIT